MWLAEIGGVTDAFPEPCLPRFAGSDGPGLVVYGAGTVGRKLLAALARAGITPDAVVDRDAALWGTNVDLVPVIPISEAKTYAGAGFVAIVAVWNPHGPRFAETAEELRAAGAGECLPYHVVAVELTGVLPHYCHDVWSRLENSAERIQQSFAMLADDQSRQTYLSEVAWRLGSISASRRAPLGHQYFQHDIYMPVEHEVFVDCGAYQGDTLQAFLEGNREFRAYYAYEPDPANFAALKRYRDSLRPAVQARVSLREAATFDSSGRVHLNQAGDGSALSEAGDVVVRTIRIDDEVIEPPPTIIKADVEGAERATLLGSRRAIRSQRPVLAICVYHLPDDLWELPLLCRELCSQDYSYFMRMHAPDGWETVLYAVPKERLAGGLPSE